MNRRPFALVAAATVAVAVLSGCVQNTAPGSNGTTIHVDSTADECVLSATSAPSGSIVFSVANKGDAVTEFYVLAEDGTSVVGEVENIGPGVSRDLVVDARPGTYFTVCKPGMVGDGVGRAPFTVTESASN